MNAIDGDIIIIIIITTTKGGGGGNNGGKEGRKEVLFCLMLWREMFERTTYRSFSFFLNSFCFFMLLYP